MVKSGKRADALQALLESAGLRIREKSTPLQMPDLRPPARAEVQRIRALLGGLLDGPPLRPGLWDMQTTDGLIIELDEEFHFTRYRATTLRRPPLLDLPWAATHLAHCTTHESSAVAGGKRWTSAASEKMFGPSDPVGVFGAHGSARGKQRALYDAMKDVAAATGVVRLARISIYDLVDGVALGDVLRGKRTVPAEAVRLAVEARAYPGGGCRTGA